MPSTSCVIKDANVWAMVETHESPTIQSRSVRELLRKYCPWLDNETRGRLCCGDNTVKCVTKSAIFLLIVIVLAAHAKHTNELHKTFTSALQFVLSSVCRSLVSNDVCSKSIQISTNYENFKCSK